MKATAYTHDTLTGESSVDHIDLDAWTGEALRDAFHRLDAANAGLPIGEAFGFDLVCWAPEEGGHPSAAFVLTGQGPVTMTIAGIVYADEQ